MADKTDVLQFMVVRAPSPPAAAKAARIYIRDDAVSPTGREDVDLFSTASESAIGKVVYERVFCSTPDGPLDAVSIVLSGVIQMLPTYQPPCPNVRDGIGLEALQDRTYFVHGDKFYLVPDRLQDMAAPMAALIPLLLVALQEASDEGDSGESSLDLDELHKQLCGLLDGMPLYKIVFQGARYAPAFAQTKRALFDALYLLYLLRRRVSINLQNVINGLRVLHTLEALAMDEFVAKLRKQGKVATEDKELWATSVAVHRPLSGWDFKGLPRGLPLIADADDLAEYLAAVPVLHPLFARLHRLRQPFNDIKPIGIGDLKVVKHWLRGYKLADIAHIDNVLLGEQKVRVHRRLEKTEDVFSMSGEQVNEAQRDTQTSERFEVKREAENVLKTDLAVNAALNVGATYTGTGYTIAANVSGGFAYTRSQSETQKVSSNFARDVVDKAVKRVQTRVSQTRTTTKLFETEETNTHTLDNKEGDGHVSGLYYWLDKEYKARVFNYGKRMMFEFVLPEPAAFFVESRLHAFEATLEVPQPPQKPTLKALSLPFTADEIDEARFRQLRRQYQLDMDFPGPRTVSVVNHETNEALLQETNIQADDRWWAKSYRCRFNAPGYQVSKVRMDGSLYYWGGGNPNNIAWRDRNFFTITIDGQDVVRADFTDVGYKALYSPNDDKTPVTAAILAADDVTVVLGFQEIQNYRLVLFLDLVYSPAAMQAWRDKVYGEVWRIEKARIDNENNQAQQSYQSELSTYRNRLAELKATALNDLLQGQSEAFNRQNILRELKRQCLALLTKEFDADPSDDFLTTLDAVSTRTVSVEYPRFKVTEMPDAGDPTDVTAGFDIVRKDVEFSAPDLAIARQKGRYVQFLEQAFEWQQLAYICYPYFWATPPKWVELMSRSDSADPFLTAFLQAGSARVLVAVTPAYDDAVLHYLASGEPWEGGPSPVIGDPLFIPLYDELRRQQDDLANAVAEGPPWTFTLPTSLVYLQDSSTPLPPPDDSD